MHVGKQVCFPGVCVGIILSSMLMEEVETKRMALFSFLDQEMGANTPTLLHQRVVSSIQHVGTSIAGLPRCSYLM